MTEGPQERPAALEPGHAYLHEHGIPHEHAHGHSHSHTQTRAVINRLARAIGHLERVKAMLT